MTLISGIVQSIYTNPVQIYTLCAIKSVHSVCVCLCVCVCVSSSIHLIMLHEPASERERLC